MSVSVVMPKLGESIAEGTITKWHVKVGDVVTKDQVLLTVSTDKADTDVPSPAAGVVRRILAEEQAVVPVEGRDPRARGGGFGRGRACGPGGGACDPGGLRGAP
jgi:pyruvate dehydrogenase E2 component (dihydrolipoamide acetyltransferase)